MPLHDGRLRRLSRGSTPLDEGREFLGGHPFKALWPGDVRVATSGMVPVFAEEMGGAWLRSGPCRRPSRVRVHTGPFPTCQPAGSFTGLVKRDHLFEDVGLTEPTAPRWRV